MSRQVYGGPTSFLRFFSDLIRRFYVVLLVFFAFLFILIGKADHVVIDKVQTGTEAAVTPIVDLVSVPVRLFKSSSDAVTRLIAVRKENEKLLAEREILREWETAARRLQSENNALRKLLNYVPPPELQFVSARVVASKGGFFAQELVALAGSDQGVRKGQIAMTGEGIVGRVAALRKNASHIMLITDINSRIPVKIENTNIRAILAGDNSDQPLLIALPLHQMPQVGDRVVTSHQSDLFPEGLPVGIVSSVSNRTIRVQPYAVMGDIFAVRIVDFGLSSILSDPETEEDA